jgi:hypothetical protein
MSFPSTGLGNAKTSAGFPTQAQPLAVVAGGPVPPALKPGVRPETWMTPDIIGYVAAIMGKDGTWRLSIMAATINQIARQAATGVSPSGILTAIATGVRPASMTMSARPSNWIPPELLIQYQALELLDAHQFRI